MQPLAGKSGIGPHPLAPQVPPSVNQTPTAHQGGNPWQSCTTVINRELPELRAELAEDGVKFVTETDTRKRRLRCHPEIHWPKDEPRLTPQPRTIATSCRGLCRWPFLFDGEDDPDDRRTQGPACRGLWRQRDVSRQRRDRPCPPMTDRVTYLEEGDRRCADRTSSDF